MSRKKNPYKVAENVAGRLADGLFVLIAVGSVGLVAFLLGKEYGPWALLAFPIMVILMVLVALYWLVVDWVSSRWRQAKWRWENEKEEK